MNVTKRKLTMVEELFLLEQESGCGNVRIPFN